PAAARRRPHRRPRRPEVRPRRRRAARAALPPRAGCTRQRRRQARTCGGASCPRAGARGGAVSVRDRLSGAAGGVPVTVEEARRIAIRAQWLDGRAKGVLSTVRRLGFLQLDPISSVAPPQQLVLWSRLGPWDTAE